MASKKAGIHDAYIKTDMLKIKNKIKGKRLDVVLALDLIEHLSKEEGERLLDIAESIATKKIFILTPNGFVKQGPYGNNPYQVHLSGWTAADFRSRGYSVFGMRGLKWIRGEYATISRRPWFFWAGIATITQYFNAFFLNFLFNS